MIGIFKHEVDTINDRIIIKDKYQMLKSLICAKKGYLVKEIPINLNNKDNLNMSLSNNPFIVNKSIGLNYFTNNVNNNSSVNNNNNNNINNITNNSNIANTINLLEESYFNNNNNNSQVIKKYYYPGELFDKYSVFDFGDHSNPETLSTYSPKKNGIKNKLSNNDIINKILNKEINKTLNNEASNNNRSSIYNNLKTINTMHTNHNKSGINYINKINTINTNAINNSKGINLSSIKYNFQCNIESETIIYIVSSVLRSQQTIRNSITNLSAINNTSNKNILNVNNNINNISNINNSNMSLNNNSFNSNKNAIEYSLTHNSKSITINNNKTNKTKEIIYAQLTQESLMTVLSSNMFTFFSKHIFTNNLIPSNLINFKEITIIAELGKGGFGVVVLIKYKMNFFAMKIISHDYLKLKRNYRDYFNGEINFTNQVISPFVTQIKTVSFNEMFCFYIMDYSSSLTLRTVIKDLQVYNLLLPLLKVKEIIVNLVIALETVHSKKIIHRDIKPENIIIESNGYIKLIDFGLAKKLIKGYANSILGSPYYMSPEQVLGSLYNTSCDYWAVGVILYELLYGFNPFKIPNCPSVIHIYKLIVNPSNLEYFDFEASKRYDKNYYEGDLLGYREGNYYKDLQEFEELRTLVIKLLDKNLSNRITCFSEFCSIIDFDYDSMRDLKYKALEIESFKIVPSIYYNEEDKEKYLNYVNYKTKINNNTISSEDSFDDSRNEDLQNNKTLEDRNKDAFLSDNDFLLSLKGIEYSEEFIWENILNKEVNRNKIKVDLGTNTNSRNTTENKIKNNNKKTEISNDVGGDKNISNDNNNINSNNRENNESRSYVKRSTLKIKDDEIVNIEVNKLKEFIDNEHNDINNNFKNINDPNYNRSKRIVNSGNKLNNINNNDSSIENSINKDISDSNNNNELNNEKYISWLRDNIKV